MRSVVPLFLNKRRCDNEWQYKVSEKLTYRTELGRMHVRPAFTVLKLLGSGNWPMDGSQQCQRANQEPGPPVSRRILCPIISS